MSSSSGGGELATWKGRVTDVIFSGGFDTKKVKLRRHMKVKDEPLLSANLGPDWCNRSGCGGLSEASCPKQVLAFQNSFASSHDTLQVHCKSGDDDLGVHFVKFGDPVYSIRFGDNIFKGTYWDCFIQHGPKMEYFLRLGVFVVNLLE
ncbi:BnaC03g72870D [Brassica napus]|uniref:S-protein homolog n=1 Tax=Brassica napus TaxID=3708 RepID=A0A078J8V4_BRANA|nr:BnaC03g72870D [Brassica napus]